MQKLRGLKVLSIVSLCISLLGLIVVYYVIVHRSSNLEAAVWNVRFQNIEAKKHGKATYELPTISDTSISDSKISFHGSGDSVTFTFDVENRGTIDAILGTIFKGSLKCTGTGSNALKDANDVCENLRYQLKYNDGKSVSNNDLLNKGSSRTVKLVLTSKASPVNAVTVTGFNMAMIYHQNS